MVIAAGQGDRVPVTGMNERLGSYATRLLVLLLFLGLALIMTYPLVLNMRTAVPGPPWDQFVWLYDLWWFRHSIVDLGEWPVHNPTIFHPYGYDLRLSETTLASKALAAPFLFWGDEVLAYNALILISFVLTGYTTYLLIAYLTGNPYAAVVGAAVFAFSPFRMHAMAAGWLPLLSTQWIPLVFLYLERTLREGRTRSAAAAGFFLGLTILSSWYYLYIVGSMAILFLLLRTRPWRETLRQRRTLANIGVVGVVALILVAPVGGPVLLERSGEMGWTLKETEKWAASLEDFFLPNVYHPVWGDHFLRLRSHTMRYPWYAPGFVYLGTVAVLLVAGAVLKQGASHEIVTAFFWLGAISFVLALGVVLHWNNKVVELRVNPAVETFFARGMSTLMSKWALNKASYYEIDFGKGTIPVPLPGLLVYLFVPLGNAMRTLYRFGVVTVFSVSVLAGIGTAQILGGGREPATMSRTRGRYDTRVEPRPAPIRGSLTVTIVLAALVLFDFWSAPLAYGLSDVRPQPIDRWLAARPEEAIVMQFPLIRALSGDSLYRTKYHEKRAAYGHGTFYPAEYQYAMPVLASFPSDRSLDVLKSWGVSHVIVGSRVYDAGWGDRPGQTWEKVLAQIESTSRLRPLGVIYDEPFWHDERVSKIIRGSPPVVPILVDKVYVYELR